jgi:hypothetical protein
MVGKKDKKKNIDDRKAVRAAYYELMYSGVSTRTLINYVNSEAEKRGMTYGKFVYVYGL